MRHRRSPLQRGLLWPTTMPRLERPLRPGMQVSFRVFNRLLRKRLLRGLRSHHELSLRRRPSLQRGDLRYPTAELRVRFAVAEML